MPAVLENTIEISVHCRYAPERSAPLKNLWFFIYRIRIHNVATQSVRLLSRHWLITNAEGVVSEVYGAGVVGEQPLIAPGEAFEYTSACPLDSPFGMMRGNYTMIANDGTHFDVAIPSFSLSQPHALN
ncbi:MAG: Co2+/Mg2+ efflux protein ApaG [Bradymonadaceae bacterium]|nr:Co2+/Mg2+ efflux protein ApaG [Lujinxingiaceae bacterium]